MASGLYIDKDGYEDFYLDPESIPKKRYNSIFQ